MFIAENERIVLVKTYKQTILYLNSFLLNYIFFEEIALKSEKHILTV